MNNVKEVSYALCYANVKYLLERKDLILYDNDGFQAFSSLVNLTRSLPDNFYFHSSDFSKISLKIDQIPVLDLVPLRTCNIYITGKDFVTYKDVLSQIPDDITDKTTAFALGNSPKLVTHKTMSYFELPVTYFGYNPDWESENSSLPKAEELIRPIDYEKSEKYKDRIWPVLDRSLYNVEIINEHGLPEYAVAVDPDGDGEHEAFIYIPIIDLNTHLLFLEKYQYREPIYGLSKQIEIPYKKEETVTVYQDLYNGSTGYAPQNVYACVYAQLISQIPDDLLTDDVIGLLYLDTTLHRVRGGKILQKSRWQILKRA